MTRKLRGFLRASRPNPDDDLKKLREEPSGVLGTAATIFTPLALMVAIGVASRRR